MQTTASHSQDDQVGMDVNFLLPGFHGHVAGCYENEDGKIIFDLTVADGNVFFFFPPDGQPDGSLAKRNNLKSPTTRWTLDPKAKTDTRIEPTEIFDTSGEFSRIDDRFVTKSYNQFWQARVDPTRPYDFAKCGPPAGGLFNTLGHYTWNEKTEDTYWAGPTATFQEPTFIPKAVETCKEGEGYLIALLNHLDVLRNDIVIFDAQNLAQGPLATIHLPMKLRLGLHGNFVDQRDIEEWQQRRSRDGNVGPVRKAERPLAWQNEILGTNGSNGDVNGRTNGNAQSHANGHS